jgi:ABC-2 type transport system ATP-binding protein
MPVTSAIEIRGLRKRYRRVDALSGLNLEVPEGTVCGFLGPNGAGKTTTMKILMGLIRPSDGWVSILEEELGRNSMTTRSRIGYLPQDPAFFPKATVPQVLRFAARRYLAGSRSDIDDRVDETLTLVGLEDRTDRKVKALSGGELRRLGIGQAVIGDPDLLILDEPSVGLDPEGRRQVLELLEGLKGQMTIFYSSHILDDVERIADHVVIIDHGKVVEQGATSRFLEGSSAAYAVALDGDGADAIDRLGREAWVTATRAVGTDSWEIDVADRMVAERELLRLLVSGNRTWITELRPLERRLEDIYLELVEVSDDG